MITLYDPEHYQPKVRAQFHKIERQLQPYLPHCSIEHIGASAIPGALSKGDLDICVVTQKGQMPTTIDTLLSLGYEKKTDTLQTHQLCMMVPLENNLDIALQVIEKGSEFEFFLHFRDALIANQQWVRAYNRIKQEAADLPADEYRARKSRFIHFVLQQTQSD